MLLPGDISIWTRILILLFAIPGAVLFFLGIEWVLRRKVLKGSIGGLVGLLLLGIAALMIPVLTNLDTYHPLIEVSFKKTYVESYEVEIRLGKRCEHLDSWGDSLQISARILKWHGLPARMGFKSFCRPESSKTSCFQSYPKMMERSLFSQEQGLDLWVFIKNHDKWIPWMGAVYGSTRCMPAIDGAIYHVSFTGDELSVRPVNNTARKALDEITAKTSPLLDLSNIRDEYQSIIRTLRQFRTKSINLYDYSPRGGQAKAFVDTSGDIRRLEVELDSDLDKKIEAYYYRNGSLIFAHFVFHRYIDPQNTSEKPNETGVLSINGRRVRSEMNRYYFKKGKMILWVNNEGREVDINSAKFAETEKEVLNFSDELILKFK